MAAVALASYLLDLPVECAKAGSILAVVDEHRHGLIALHEWEWREPRTSPHDWQT